MAFSKTVQHIQQLLWKAGEKVITVRAWGCYSLITFIGSFCGEPSAKRPSPFLGFSFFQTPSGFTFVFCTSRPTEQPSLSINLKTLVMWTQSAPSPFPVCSCCIHSSRALFKSLLADFGCQQPCQSFAPVSSRDWKIRKCQICVCSSPYITCKHKSSCMFYTHGPSS